MKYTIKNGNKFVDISIEPSLLLSIFQGIDTQNFRKIGITDKLVEKLLLHYNNTKEVKEYGYELDSGTREFCIWVYNQISELFGIEGYMPKQLFKINNK